ncbi:hypothetical protein COW98_05145 [Candidatus Roizmanbacteria bacterium CG22_combo_CG10-13_8_21_14_all_35_9]|uniref:Uncharacterized protein n=1 Tax=Candidatus Roizmanbacteria bacterium CG22_combo_CG10-13_8_21_14_all_35_9 TaxID=1974861 RepID=A0A2H0BXA3_9BACT|nr:MAG: hypothetical protein COW98_05145 [Candidatus Roizmanbacteria bacterium CG22_combo_CG10-13_8_21_14_all_35_9]
MAKLIELKIKTPKNIYQKLTHALCPHREEPARSLIFIVEGTKKRPIIGIRYPGKKLRKRELKAVRVNSALWANLYDFEVVPYKNGKEINTQKFTFDELLKDFQENKKNSKRFWMLLEELYNDNVINKKPPKLPGIDSTMYLLVLKWIWIQEDFNYRFNWEEVDSPIRYVLETRTGTRTGRGAGRAKFFAALILLKEYFNFEQVKKIIPLY